MTAYATTTDLPTITFLGSMHEGVPVDDANLDACIRFYVDVLGMQQIPRPKALDDIGRGAWLTDANKTVQFHLISTATDFKPGPAAKRSPTGRHTAWLVQDLGAFRARLDALGVEYGELKNLLGTGSAQLFVTDPEGHTWEFQEPSPRR